MTQPLISHGASGEKFIAGDLGIEIDVETLLLRVNATPREELDIRESPTADLVGIARQNGFNPFKIVSTKRMDEPIVVVTLTFHGKRQSWVIDGTHRLHARHRSGKLKTRFVAIKAAMIRDLIRPH